MKQTLVLETSSSAGSWALFEDETLCASDSFVGRASGKLLESLEKVRPRLNQVGEIVVGVGPGSFSGIRVAIATAQGLAFGWNCPVIPCRSSHAIAWKHSDASYLGVFADAKRRQLFFTAYEHGKLRHKTVLIPVAEVENSLGKCSLAVSPEPLPPIPLSEAPVAEALGLAYFKFGPEPHLRLEPIYLHDAVAGA